MKHSAEIRAVTFDVGGTLIEPWPSVGHVYAEVAARHGFNELSIDRLNRQFSDAWRARRDFDYSRAAWAELTDLAFAGVCDAVPSRSFFSELYEQFSTPSVWRIYDDVKPALEELRECGLRTGIISNWDERLAPLLCRLDLDRLFDSIVVSHTAGVCKPAPGIFLRAAGELNLAPRYILHLGDSPIEDLDGARAAGMGAVLIQRRQSEAGEDCLTSLRDILPLLSS